MRTSNPFRETAVGTSLLALNLTIEKKSSIAFSGNDGKSYLIYQYPFFKKRKDGKMIKIDKKEFETILRMYPHDAISIAKTSKSKTTEDVSFRLLEYKSNSHLRRYKRIWVCHKMIM